MSIALRSPQRLRALRFVTVGLGAALILFVLSFLFRSLGALPFVASTVAYALAFAVAYAAQHGWTFGGVHSHGKAFPRYLAAQVGCALVSGTVAYVAVEIFGGSPLWMSVAVTLTAGAASYVLTIFWVFPSPTDTG